MDIIEMLGYVLNWCNLSVSVILNVEHQLFATGDNCNFKNALRNIGYRIHAYMQNSKVQYRRF